jgi:small subunit ribosomal protein S11
MGKKRVATKAGGTEGTAQTASSRVSRKRLDSGTLFIEATYNNTKVSLATREGDVVTWSSSGSLGFKGAKKGTPFAAAKVGELIGDRAKQFGIREITAIISGVGSGRESAIRSFLAKSGATVSSLQDRTPVPFNGPRPKKPRRV